MIIKIVDGEAKILTEEEISKERKERVSNYWIKIKDTDGESFIINYDKNKVRPFMRDYISRLPGSLEIRYLTIVIVIISIMSILNVWIWLTRSYGSQLNGIEKNTKEITKIIDILQKKEKFIPEKIPALDNISDIKPTSSTGVFINPLK